MTPPLPRTSAAMNRTHAPSTPLAVALLALAALACGRTESEPPAVTPTPSGTTPPPPPPTATAPLRTLTTKPPTPTRTDNLVVDPEMQSLWTALDETGFGIYESFVDKGRAEARFLAESPAGPGVAGVSIKPNGTSEATLVLLVTGGSGPLAASVWIAAPEGAPPPVVELSSLYEQDSVRLVADPASAKDVGGTKFVAFRASVPRDMPGQLYLTAAFRGSSAVTFVAPQVVPASKDEHGPSTRARRTDAATHAARRLEDFRARHLVLAGPPRPDVPLAARGPR